MRWPLVLHLVGALTACVGLCMAFPALASVWYGGGDLTAILESMAATLAAGLLLYFGFRRFDRRQPMNHREGMAVTALGWLAAGVFGALPFVLSGHFGGFTDSVFESVSGFTTTGASILTDIEAVPKGLIFWRALTHWLGGMGIIVLSLAILPYLGVGGMQLYKAEVPGPTPDKLKPRIRDTAVALWKVYVLLTAVLAAIFMLGGMDLYESLCHTFATVATGGFSTRNASLAAYGPFVQYAATLFMLLAGMNFALHYRLLKGSPGAMWRDPEWRGFCWIYLAGTAVATVCVFDANYQSVEESFRHASFQAASILTTTGFVTADYEAWPYLAQGVLLLCMFVGGSAGSTGGGIKVMRLQVVAGAVGKELKRLVHPRAVYQVKLGGRVVPEDVLSGIWGFCALWLALYFLGVLVIAASGVDLLTSFGAGLACMGNVGPGVGSVGPIENYAHLPDLAKWTLVVLMILGRLELFTIIILFVPEFWRK